MTDSIRTLNDAADKLTAQYLAGQLGHAAYERGSAYLASLAAKIEADRKDVELAWERGDLTTEQTGPLLDALDTRESALTLALVVDDSGEVVDVRPIGWTEISADDTRDGIDTRPRNAFGYLEGFGKAYREYYERRDDKSN